MLLAASVTPVQVSVAPLTWLVTSLHLLPPSSEANTFSPAAGAVLSVAVMVCAASLVFRSILLLPLSLEKRMVPKVVLGALWSST